MKRIFLVSLLALPSALGASATRAEDAVVNEALVRTEMQGALERLSEVGALPSNGAAVSPIALSIPATRVVSLGVLLDGQGAAGPLVIGTTPGGVAQSLGVRTGDVLVSINGVALEHSPAAVAQIRATLDALPDQAPLSLRVLRQGQGIDLTGSLTAHYLPPMRMEIGEANLIASTADAAIVSTLAVAGAAATQGEGCGRISVFNIAPRSKDLYGSHVLAIDGRIPGASTQETYRVKVGTHTLTVTEDIDWRELPMVYSRVRPDHQKILSIDVRAGVTYMIAARLNADRRSKVASGQYWDPVVWKEISEPCGK